MLFTWTFPRTHCTLEINKYKRLGAECATALFWIFVFGQVEFPLLSLYCQSDTRKLKQVLGITKYETYCSEAVFIRGRLRHVHSTRCKEKDFFLFAILKENMPNELVFVLDSILSIYNTTFCVTNIKMHVYIEYSKTIINHINHTLLQYELHVSTIGNKYLKTGTSYPGHGILTM